MHNPDKDMVKSASVAEDLLNLYDEVAEFTDCCAFLCEAFASLAAREVALDTSTIRGFKYLSNWMKGQMVEIKHRLGAIQEKCYSSMEGKE